VIEILIVEVIVERDIEVFQVSMAATLDGVLAADTQPVLSI
jgi:hypothetical protein